MPAASAWRISARVLPTPEKITLAGSAPAASTRASSPPETMSKPQPACGEDAQHAERRVGLDRIADQRIAALEAALVGAQRVEHPLLGIHEQRRAVLPVPTPAARHLRHAGCRRGGRCGGGRGAGGSRQWSLRRPCVRGRAAVRRGRLGGGLGSSNSGSVARSRAAGSVGQEERAPLAATGEADPNEREAGGAH